MLNTDAIEEGLYGCLEIHFLSQCAFALGSSGRNVGFQQIAFAPETDGAVGQETSGADGFAEHLSPPLVETHQLHVNGIGIFGGSDDAQAVARKGMGVVVDVDIHILVGGRGKTLGSRLARIADEGDGRFTLCIQNGRVEQAGAFFLLEQAGAFGAVDTWTIYPTVGFGLPGLGIGISGFMAVNGPVAVFDERLGIRREIVEVGFEDIRLRNRSL